MKFERLGNIVTIEKGRKSTIIETPTENSIRVIQIDDLRNDNNIKYTNDKTGVISKKEDLIIAWDGANAGTIGFGKTGFIGSTLALLRKINSTDFDTVFIGKFLQTKSNYLRNKSTGATIPHINRNSLENLKIPLLSIRDQIHVANILTKIESIIEQRKLSIDLIEEFLKSKFLELFGSSKHPKFDMDEIAKYAIKITDGTHLGPNFISSGVPFLLVSNIVNNEINYNTKNFISEKDYLELNKRTPIEKGDILITSVGSYGNPALVKTITRFAFQRHIAYIKPDSKKINNLYLFGALKSDFAKLQIEKAVKGAAQKTLNLSDLRKLKIPVPPNTLQTLFANIVTIAEKLKEQYKNSLVELNNLHESLSQQAFKGDFKL